MGIKKKRFVREILNKLGYSTEASHSSSMSIEYISGGYLYYSYNGTEYKANINDTSPEPINPTCNAAARFKM